MKVFELINQLKGTTATLEKIKEWSYVNRIPPCGLEEGLELDCEFPNSLNILRNNLCAVTDSCYPDCLNTFFGLEVGDEENKNDYNNPRQTHPCCSYDAKNKMEQSV